MPGPVSAPSSRNGMRHTASVRMTFFTGSNSPMEPSSAPSRVAGVRDDAGEQRDAARARADLFHHAAQRLGFRSAWSCRSSAFDRVAILHSSLKAPEEIRQPVRGVPGTALSSAMAGDPAPVLPAGGAAATMRPMDTPPDSFSLPHAVRELDQAGDPGPRPCRPYRCAVPPRRRYGRASGARPAGCGPGDAGAHRRGNRRPRRPRGRRRPRSPGGGGRGARSRAPGRLT